MTPVPNGDDAYRAEPSDEDGLDPREYFRKRGVKPVNRKALQLCSRVRDALSWILSSEFDDEVIQGLDVVQVLPAPSTAHLLVWVTPSLSAPVTNYNVLMQHLHAVMPRIRVLVAASIHRRKAPELTFLVVAIHDGSQ